ncbi:sugar nucleotide-binding protein, partial [uncultured Flavobacterium sp.]
MVVLVTGANGQLGQSLQFIAEKHPEIEFVFCDSKKLDITDYDNVNDVFNEFIPDYCINAAAYTAVDKAESEPEKAYSINVLGPQNLSKLC